MSSIQYDIKSSNYESRVYAGVLGKIIGVYLGRPFEQWSHDRILRELGEVHYYVNHTTTAAINHRELIVADDDITGTFTFVRALEDHGYPADLSPAQVGHTWLNYIIENKSILWWGGMGMSTEHTAFIRLKQGIEAPHSGSIATNGKTVAEQIGAQIFIDGWGMIAGGDPALAADLAKRAGSVSHDGEAVYAAQVIAAIEAAAFYESDVQKLINVGIRFIPESSLIFQLIAELRAVRAETNDWYQGLARIHEKYSYEIFDSNCHVVPNHAIVMLALLWGNGEFDRSLMIANTAGYDTDCNSANVGCILAILNGLEAINQNQDWRGPVADRVLLPTADGGSCVNDALTVATDLVKAGRCLRGLPSPAPKNNARFHFSQPGSVQGFTTDLKTPAAVRLSNAVSTLTVHFHHLAKNHSAIATTQTFLLESQAKRKDYQVVATPTLYSGQKIHARVRAVAQPVNARLIMRYFGQNDLVVAAHSDIHLLQNDWSEIIWICPDTAGQPIADIGIEVLGPAAQASIEIDFLDWGGAPKLCIKRLGAGNVWRRSWVEAGSSFAFWGNPSRFMLIQNQGRGLAITGTRQWVDYEVRTTIAPNMIKEFGLAARVQGLERFCAILIGVDQRARLVEVMHTQRLLAEMPFDWEFDSTAVSLCLAVVGNRVTATINQTHQLTGELSSLLNCGGIAIVSEEGTLCFDQIDVCSANDKNDPATAVRS